MFYLHQQQRIHYFKKARARDKKKARDMLLGNCRCYGSVNQKSENCRFRFSVCHALLKSVCRYSGNSCKSRTRKGRPNNVYTLEESEKEIESQSQPRPSGELKVDSVSDYEAFVIYNARLGDKKVKPYKVTVNIGNVDINMELDTGATCSTLSEKLYNEHLSGFPVHETDITLPCYTGFWFQFLLSICDPVIYRNNPYKLVLLVVKGNKPALFGRDWLKHIKINWENICNRVTASVEGKKSCSVAGIIVYKRLPL